VSTHDLHALPQLCDEAVLLMHRVLMHGPPDMVLQPANLAMAFGLDVLNRENSGGSQSASSQSTAALSTGSLGTGSLETGKGRSA
jgi:manganese transport system ATP-binding protein